MSNPIHLNSSAVIVVPDQTVFTSGQDTTVPPVLFAAHIEAYDYERDAAREDRTSAKIYMSSGAVHTIIFPNPAERNKWLRVVEQKVGARH